MAERAPRAHRASGNAQIPFDSWANKWRIVLLAKMGLYFDRVDLSHQSPRITRPSLQALRPAEPPTPEDSSDIWDRRSAVGVGRACGVAGVAEPTPGSSTPGAGRSASASRCCPCGGRIAQMIPAVATWRWPGGQRASMSNTITCKAPCSTRHDLVCPTLRSGRARRHSTNPDGTRERGLTKGQRQPSEAGDKSGLAFPAQRYALL